MHIGVIIPQSKFFGGGPRIALELCQGLRRLGHKITIYTFRHVDDPETNYYHLLEGIGVVSLPDTTEFKPRKLFVYLPLPGMSTIDTYLKEHRLAKLLATRIDPHIDALLPQSNRISVLACHYFKKRVKKIPAIWQMNDMVTQTHKRCYTDSWTESSCSRIEETAWKIFDRFDRRYLKPIDEIAVLANVIKDQAREGIKREAVVVRTGVNVEQFTYKERHALSGRRATLLCHAQFFPHRRFEDAVEGLSILLKRGYDVRLILSGDGETYRSYRDYRDKVRAHAEKLGVIDRVSFPGLVSEEAFLKELHDSDIFVFPHVRQSWGLVPFEAMATGLPVLASNQAGASEVLTDGENALIIPGENPTALADAAARLIDDGALYEKLSKTGTKFVREVITWDNYAKGMLAFIEKHR